MKGTVLGLLERIVEDGAGAERWSGAVLQTLSDETGTPADQLGREVGRDLFPELARRHPRFLAGVHDALTFLVSVDTLIHGEVHELEPSAVLPRIRLCPEGDDRATLIYRSRHGSCALLEGLLGGVAAWFDQDLDVEHHRCTHRGDADCRFRLVFGAARRRVA